MNSLYTGSCSLRILPTRNLTPVILPRKADQKLSLVRKERTNCIPFFLKNRYKINSRTNCEPIGLISLILFSSIKRRYCLSGLFPFCTTRKTSNSSFRAFASNKLCFSAPPAFKALIKIQIFAVFKGIPVYSMQSI